MWDANTPVHSWVLIEIVLGLGLGGNFQNMLLAIQATIHYSDIAVATAAFSFIVLLGATLGIAIGGTVFQNQMTKLSADLPDIPGLSAITGVNAGASVSAIQALPPDVKTIVIQNYAQSLRMVWIVLAAFAGAGLLVSFLIGRHELHKEYVPRLSYRTNCSIRTNQPAMMKKKQLAPSTVSGNVSSNLSDCSTEIAVEKV
jgi:hypothetical protein